MARTLLGTAGLVVVLLWHASAAQAESGYAQAEDEYAQPGIYLGGGLGIGIPTFDTDPIDHGAAIGFNTWLGYRMAARFAVELQLEYVFNFKDPDLDSTLDALAFTGNAKFYALTGAIQPFALVGIGLGRQVATLGALKGDTVDLVHRFGGGVDFYGSSVEGLALSIAASYVLGTGDLRFTRYMSVTGGVQYRF